MTIQQFWLDHDEFTIDEAAYLLLGRNPRQPGDTDAAELANKREVLYRAIKSGVLSVVRRGGQLKRVPAFDEVGCDDATDSPILAEREPESDEITMRGTGHGSEDGRLYIFRIVSEGEDFIPKRNLAQWMLSKGYTVPESGLKAPDRLAQLFDEGSAAYSERLAMLVDTWFHLRERAEGGEKISNSMIAAHINSIMHRYMIDGSNFEPKTGTINEMATVCRPTRKPEQ